MSIADIVLLVTLYLTSYHLPIVHDDLELRVRPYATEVVEKCPLVVRLTVANAGEDVIDSIFSARDDEILIDRAALHLTDDSGRQYVCQYRGGLIPERPEPIPIERLNPGESRSADRLFLFVVPAPDNYADHGYGFVPAGAYKAHAEVQLLGDEILTSQPFDLIVRSAQGADSLASDLVRFRHAGFFGGRDVSIKQANYDGRELDGKVDVSRFGEIQRILSEHPDSIYAEWIRFWKVYYMGSVDDALRYAREHREFPLSDNLLLHCAEGLFNQRDYGRARELAAEILRDFPDGDTRARVEQLQEKLRNKP